MTWIIYLIIATLAIEAIIIWFYYWTKDNLPEQSPWVILGSKVFKLLVAAIAIVSVHFLSEDIPLKEFCYAIIGAYFATLIIETVFFLKKKK